MIKTWEKSLAVHPVNWQAIRVRKRDLEDLINRPIWQHIRPSLSLRNG